MLDSRQIAGFVVGEGCFYIEVSRDDSYNCGYQCRLGFEIEVRDDDEPILREIQHVLGCGNVYHLDYERYAKWKPHAKYRVSNLKDIYDKVIPFFADDILFGRKKEVYDLFCRAAEIIKAGRHRTPGGVQELLDIKKEMKRYGKK